MSKGLTQNSSRKATEVQRKSSNRWLSAWPFIASLSILTYGLYRAIDLRWVCDEPFITYRYVRNFLDGNGLVYNIGERVEGYTHFLWLMLLSAAQAIGFDPVDSSMWLGIASYAGILVFLLAISFREHKKNPKALWLPLAAALYALNYDTTVFSSGGLETSLYAFLILAAFYLWFYSSFSERRRLLFTGVLLALVPLTRPDGILFTLTAIVLLAISGIRRKKSVLSISKSIGILILPSIAIGLPYLTWKYFYYGNLLPNTYYAKSGDENYLDQGFFYIWLYFRVHFTSAIALVAAACILLWRRGKDEPTSNDSFSGSPTLTAFVCIAVYLLLFVARSGGDFIFARFIVPVAGFIYFVIERAFDRIPVKMPKYRTAIALLLLVSVLVENKLRYYSLFHIDEHGNPSENWGLPETMEGSTRGIADERWAYYNGYFINAGTKRGPLEVYSEIGKFLEPFFEGIPITVAIPGGMNMIAYYANFSACINEYGLTDAFIAHLPVTAHARIGHEKKAPEEYLIRRNVDIELGKMVPELPNKLGVNEIAFEIPELGLWQLARLVTYNKTLINQLKDRFSAAGNRSHLPIYEHIIPNYVEKKLPSASLNDIEDSYANFRQFYFDKYPDTALEHRFEERIAELKQPGLRR